MGKGMWKILVHYTAPFPNITHSYFQVPFTDVSYLLSDIFHQRGIAKKQLIKS